MSSADSDEALRPSIDLCGRHILYVGGRKTQISHLRRLVEDCNGRFFHHDGGMEESMKRLYRLVGRADAILFPVDCVSHAAQAEVKRFCRLADKPYLPIRRTGGGGFRQALEAVAAQA